MVVDNLLRLTFNESMDALPIRDSFPDEQLFPISTLPWYANIVNFLVIGQTPSHWSAQDKKRFMVEYSIFSMMILIYLSIVQIKSLGDVSLIMKYLVSSPFVIMKLVEATFLQGKPLQRFCNVVFIGLICLKTLIIFANLVSLVKSWEE